MLPTVSRLRTARDFSAVVRGGRRAGAGTLVVHLLARTTEPTVQGSSSSGPGSARAGFVVTRKIGNAVMRHRITRQLRPLVRRRLADLPDGVDLVIRALPAASGATSAALEHDLDRALSSARRKAGLPAAARR